MSLTEAVRKSVADLLFPPFCVSCNSPGAWWCEVCRSSIQTLDGRICPACLTVGDCGGNCAGSLPFASVSSFGYYHDPKLRSVITALKFNGTTVLLDDLKSFAFSRPMELPRVDAVIPMPLSDKRLRERGFNQAQLIAEAISPFVRMRDADPSDPTGRLPAPVVHDVLFRTSDRVAQSSLEHNAESRRANVAGAFGCCGEIPEEILLVDDVATTGATASEATMVLLASGTRNVHLLTLAIGA